MSEAGIRPRNRTYLDYTRRRSQDSIPNHRKALHSLIGNRGDKSVVKLVLWIKSKQVSDVLISYFDASNTDYHLHWSRVSVSDLLEHFEDRIGKAEWVG